LITDYEQKHFPLSAADPVEAIRFRMEQMDLSQKDLVPYIGSKSKVSEILSGKRRLTLPMIRALSEGLGIPARVLVQDASETSGGEKVEAKLLPLRHMASRGYFGHVPRGRKLMDSAETLVRQFLGPLGNRPIYALTKQSQHMRSPRGFDKYALFAWTAQVMRRALAQNRESHYRAGMIDDDFMRKVAQLSWSSRGPLLAQEFLAQHGISLVVERHFPKTYLDGAALLADPDHPVIGMTLRHDRLDNFWFCLMHELIHIRFHIGEQGQQFYFDDLDQTEGVGAREVEADEMAREILVPRHEWENSAARHLRSPDAAVALARHLGVSVAVVAGRMRYEWKDFSILNSLLGQRSVRSLFREYGEAAGA
jgi:HTH-type transcriptional regulator/antitoxin HigA